MYNYPKNAGLRLETAGPTQDVATTGLNANVNANVKAPAAQPAAVRSSVDSSDKLRISDIARADSPPSLTPMRAAAIRARVLNGAYDTLAVVDSVARRLLDSGDL
jgi:hypothetical protein